MRRFVRAIVFTLAPLLGAAGLTAAASDRVAATVQAPDSPVRIDKAVVVSTADAPPVLVYAAVNTSDAAIDEFTVIAFVFDATGTLKARQTAPGRRGLNPHETKYSTLVLDGSPVAPTDIVVVGVNQAQRVGSNDWWRANLQSAAEAAAARAKPRG